MNRCELSKFALCELEAVYRLANRLSPASDGAAEKLVEETYAVALQIPDRVPLDAKAVRLWLFSVLHSVLRARRVDEHGEGVASFPEEFSLEATPDAAARILRWYELSSADWNRLDARLHQAIDGLPLRYRIVFLLWSAEGLSTRQIGSIVEAEEPIVRARLLRAMMAVATQLGQAAPGWIEEPMVAATV